MVEEPSVLSHRLASASLRCLQGSRGGIVQQSRGADWVEGHGPSRGLRSLRHLNAGAHLVPLGDTRLGVAVNSPILARRLLVAAVAPAVRAVLAVSRSVELEHRASVTRVGEVHQSVVSDHSRHHHLVVIVHAVRRPRSAAHLPVHNHLHHLLIPVVDGDVILVVRKGKIDNLDHLGEHRPRVKKVSDRTAVFVQTESLERRRETCER
mmetsp:Transcript_3195/g.14898  ORF Transcript_3195/g.14898 Transcript_3195/m.14898 type:complete len:208 (-) Transcript_3195:53-676(-)